MIGRLLLAVLIGLGWLALRPVSRRVSRDALAKSGVRLRLFLGYFNTIFYISRRTRVFFNHIHR